VKTNSISYYKRNFISRGKSIAQRKEFHVGLDIRFRLVEENEKQ